MEDTDKGQQQDRHRDREGRILRVHIHVADVERAGGEEEEGDDTGKWPADASSDPPGNEQSEYADRRSNEPACLE